MLTENVTRAAKSFSLTISGFLAFLRRPEIKTSRALLMREQVSEGAWLFVLSIVVTIIFGVLALPVILATDLTAGEQLNDAMSGTLWSVLLSVVVLGPLVEELIFRGWLSGTWRSLLASACGLAAIYGGSALLALYFAQGSVIRPLILVAGAIAIISVFSPINKEHRIPAFDRLFPVIFYTQAVAFGTLHYQNYAASLSLVALFATLPLIGCGLIWGYARIRLGLVPAVMLHSAYNVPAAIGSMIMIHHAA